MHMKFEIFDFFLWGSLKAKCSAPVPQICMLARASEAGGMQGM